MHVFRTSHLAVQRLSFLFIATTCLCGMPSVVADAAQIETDVADDGQSGEAIEATKASPAAGTADGTKKSDPVLELRGAERARYLEWLKNQRNPDYSVTSVALEGAAQDDGRVKLTATIKIQVNRDDQALRIPLNLNEAILTGHEYSGKGTATPDDKFDRAAGRRWWLQGKGEHVLKLFLLVPVKKQPPKRRLTLSIPRTAVSSLSLVVPLPLDRLKSAVVEPESAWLKTKPIAKVGTQLEAFGLGRRIDLTWEPIAPQGPVETVLLSETVVDAKLTDESVFLKATQRIQAKQGLFSSVNVRLPAGFTFVEVEGKEVSGREVDDTGTHVRVALTELTKGPIELKWTLDAPFPGSGGKVTIEGFEVDRAQSQTGELAVSGLEGFRITRRVAEDRFVHRISVADLANGMRASTAYAFHKQPFRLVFDLQEIEPRFTVQPRQRLHVSQDLMQLEAAYEFQVYRGAVSEVEVHWPGAVKEGWHLELVGPVELLDRDLANEWPPTGALRIPLLQRKTGKFELQLKASRPISAGEDFPLSLPFVKASSQLPTTLDLFAEENIGVELAHRDANSSRLPVLNKIRPQSIPEDLRSLHRETYRIDNRREILTSKVVVHEREISTRSAAQIELNGRQLLVTQRIVYDVKFERLPQALLLVPKELGKRVRFSFEGGSELTTSSTPLDEGTYHEVRLLLPEPQIDEFAIVAQFSIDVPSLPLRGESTPVTITMPLVQSSDSRFGSTRLEWSHHRGIDIAPVGNQMWEAYSNLRDSSVWLADGAPHSVTLEMSDSNRKRIREFYISRALIHTVLDTNGNTRSRAQYRIDGSVPAVSLTLPPGKIVLEKAWWGTRQLRPAEIVELDASRGSYRLEDSETPEVVDRLLTVEFHSKQATPLSWSRPLDLDAPEFAAGVWVDESVWKISLPSKQLLFMQPSDYTPRYHWVRRGILWNRQPLTSHANLVDWIGATDGPANEFSTSSVNAYRFSRFGPATTLSCRIMLFKLVVLLGAGLSLAAGFVLLYVPLTRNVLTFLLLAFAVSVAALWMPAPIELLVQPAILGLLLAVVAAAINSVLHREKRVPILTLSSPNDFNHAQGSLSSVESIPVRGPGSKDLTALRPVVTANQEAVAAQESGSQL